MTKRNLAIVSIGSLATLHAASCVFFHDARSSDVLQLVAAILPTALCLRRAGNAGSRYFRWLWYSLAFAFSLWASGQAYDVWYTFAHATSLTYPNPAAFFWLLSSFPILFLAARTRGTEDDWIGVLDLIQACISAALLCAVVIFIPGVEIVQRAYDIQGVALLFACSTRYSTEGEAKERLFFRNLTIYVVSYDLLGLATQFVPQKYVVDGGIPDLAYSFPFLIFLAVSTLLPEELPRWLQWKLPGMILPAHIHGVSSLGLALTSIASGVVLTSHHTRFGILAVFLSCGVFALRTAIRESQLKRAQLQLEYDNHHDHLTGLANRALLLRELERPKIPCGPDRALLFLDLDRFKVINDSLGHSFGDRLLIHVAELLRSVVRPGDIVGRLGGDEFVVLLNDCPDNVTAEAIAARILARLRSPILLDGRVIHAGGSIGIASLQEGESITHLLRNADAAMYAAKSLGKNRVRVFDRSILEKAAHELEMETELRHAVEEDLLTIAFQPVYSLHTQSLRGFEALTRWTHPRYGAVSPDEFIPLAEDAGLIVEIGEQVLRKACRQTAEWNSRFGARMTVGVNVSGRQLADKYFLARLNEILCDSQLDPSLLKLEITESVLLSDQQSALELFAAARSKGIEIYLDDFGKGYSALNYLLKFPFDGIKIDRSFLQDVERDSRHAKVMATIVQLAKTLEKRVVAEGIETVAQHEFVTSIHCDLAQGFLFSKPLSSQGVLEMLEAEVADGEWRLPSLPAAAPLMRIPTRLSC